MNESLATLDRGELDLRKTIPYVPDDTVTRGEAMRFSYACGDRPLDGYVIKRGIGLGGFGEVYFALSDAGKEVALKRIQRHIDIELRGVSQCLNLKHVNLISLWDIREDSQGNGWVVMEYVPGGSLRDVIEASRSGMEFEKVQDWFRGIASGVRHLHNHGIVHRDLKPGNIFWDEDERVVKIGDYGLSKLMSAGRLSGQTESVGTFHYMAPEIGRGIYGKEIDLYALGIILYEMLTGQVPFDGESSQEIMMKHLTAEPELSCLQGGVRELIEKSLSKDPDRRYENIDAMLVDFEKCCETPNRSLLSETSPESWVNHDSTTSQDSSQSQADFFDGNRQDSSDVLYIADDQGELGVTGQSEMVFGDLREVVDAVPVEVREPAKRRNAGEPVARTVQNLYFKAAHHWNQSKIGTPAKVIILVVAGIILLNNSGWLVPLAGTVAVFYGLYLMARLAVRVARGTAQSAIDRKRQLARLRAVWTAQLSRQRWVPKLGELFGSFVKSGLLVLCLMLVAALASSDGDNQTAPYWALMTWLSTIAVTTSWCVLLAGKIWEKHEGDPIRRRFAMMVAGVFVGGVSFAISQYFLLDMQAQNPLNHRFVTALPSTLSSSAGQPFLAAHVIFFVLFFSAFRWWKQVDPFRKTRLSFRNVGLVLLGGTIINEVAGFPFPWMIAMVGAASIGIQLSAPWIGQAERNRLVATK